MRGQQKLEVMRRSGYAPASIHIETTPDPLAMSEDWQIHTPNCAYLQLGGGERARVADLLCVVGLLVFVHGDIERTVMAVKNACIEAGARRVVTMVDRLIPLGGADYSYEPIVGPEIFEGAEHGIAPAA